MYPIDPPALYAHESVMANPLYRARAERVAAALVAPREIIPYADADLPEMIRERGLLAGRVAMHTLENVRDPILLFNTFRFDGAQAEQARREALERAAGQRIGLDLLGAGAFIWFDSNLAGDPHRDDKVCRPCWRIHLQKGCLHKCQYCNLGGLLTAMVNIEDYCRHLNTLIERHPWQTTYLLDDDGDPPGLEPELGVLGPLIEFFGTLRNRYLIIHTKTWNTEWMRGLKHNGNTIIVWSLSGATQSRLIEPGTGATEQRIEAARIAEEAGYQIRYKFKPIVPVKQWREDAAHAVRLALEKTHPDIISLCVFMWTPFAELERKLPLDLLEPRFVDAARASQDEMKDTRTNPFPPWARQEIYEHYLTEIRQRDRDVTVSLSTESFKMWAAMRERLGATAINYVCGCGPQCVPGLKTLDAHPFRVACRNDQDSIPGVSLARS
ncbi:MAG: Spore photoproduct lyase [candidate division BRC1 bacterium ADurb.BinA364]|nr:MAG: Spore photoproduct lyase [candidate division BRC1 bacterium ADurb.BinA364]